MANKDNAKGFYWVKSVFGGSAPVHREDWTASNVGVKPGDPLAYNTSGYLTTPGTDTTSVAGFAVETITATAATRQKVKFVIAHPGYIFIGQGDGTPARTMIGDYAGFTGSSGAYELDTAGSGQSIFVIEGKVPSDSWGSDCDLYFRVRQAQFPGTVT